MQEVSLSVPNMRWHFTIQLHIMHNERTFSDFQSAWNQRMCEKLPNQLCEELRN